jgi:uncharacterized protein involved in type VI secretion and phage assembly
MNEGPFFGKYRATVDSNADPYRLGRIRAIVPAVTGKDEPSTWALPCLPAAGSGMGLFTVPAEGAGVWIEYEGGDLRYPIWVGGYWTETEVPALVPPGAPPAAAFTLQTSNGNGLVISDTPGPDGGILIKSAAGAKISIGDEGITIDNGQGAVITLKGPSVDVNGGALKVT